ncbi:hypothetical protein [Nocardioides caricicola]|uniref:Uncharacterized protein n=1 Tax=Nocardioides caricicola TaxID=634770 RepID=A0ABW0N786_9ACTN
MSALAGNRWLRRLAGGTAVFVVLELALVLAKTDPDPLRLALLVATCVGVLGLILDALADGGAAWEVTVEQPSARAGGDPRLARYVGLLEAHRTARSQDTALRDRLAALADQVLRQRHGVRRDDPRAAELLGPELVAVLDGAPRRLAPAEIDRYLTRIEEL